MLWKCLTDSQNSKKKEDIEGGTAAASLMSLGKCTGDWWRTNMWNSWSDGLTLFTWIFGNFLGIQISASSNINRTLPSLTSTLCVS